MIRTLLFASLLVAQGAFADTVLMKRQVTSGFVSPDHSFVKNCTIYQEGYAKITKRMGFGPTRRSFHRITPRRILEIDLFLQIAKFGPIVSAGVTCDGGNNIFTGYASGGKFPIDENHDCASHLINKSVATPSLKNWAMSACGF